jgi:hypothetical protein
LVAALFVALAACDPVLRVRGSVLDRTGRALENVSVVLEVEGRATRTQSTDREGSFSFTVVGAERGKATFSKSGYKTASVPVRDDGPPVRITLDAQSP